MKIIFTICSANYLSAAKTLRQSVKKHAVDSKFIYIIADKIKNRVPQDFFEGEEFIEVHDLNIPQLNEMVARYNLSEFNTAIKPFAIRHLHEKYKVSKFIFFDPDIIVYNELTTIWNNLDQYDFALTPHLLQPIMNDTFYGHQVGALNTGIFNLGFVAVNYNENSIKILQWWEKNMIEHGHCNSQIGEFYDQKIMNLLPIYSNKLYIIKDPGCNVAGWNIHERTITKTNNKYLVNGTPLFFYHYSGFVNDKEKKLISKYNQLKVEDDTALSEILENYRKCLIENGNEKLKNLKCLYDLLPDIHRANRFTVFSHKLSKLFK